MGPRDDPVRLGVIGCGVHAEGTHLPNAAGGPGIELRWCCDLDEDRLSLAAERFQPRNVTTHVGDLWSDAELEGVVISTTHDVRVPLIEAAAAAGKGVYVEKPLAGSIEEVHRICEILKAHPVPFAVGHNRRMAPAVRAAREVFQKHRRNPVSTAWRYDREGQRRPPVKEAHQAMVFSRINDDYYSWKLWGFQDGIFIGELTHFVDLISHFLESDPVAVTAVGSLKVNSVISFEFADGSLGCIFASAVGCFGYPKELWELYSEGSIIVIDHFAEVRVAGIPDEPFRRTFPLRGEEPPGEGIEGLYRRTLTAQKEAVAKADTTIWPAAADKGHAAMLSAFARHVRGEGPSPADLRSAVVSTLATLRIADAMRKAARVSIDLPDWLPAAG